MDVSLSCELCGFTLEAGETTPGPEAEHLAQLFTAIHPLHSQDQVNSYIWANGRHPAAGKQTDGGWEDGESDA